MNLAHIDLSLNRNTRFSDDIMPSSVQHEMFNRDFLSLRILVCSY